MPLKLLAVGDLHLGRTPGSLPDDLRARARELGPAAAWQRIVRRAVDERVDAVMLAGDVVEQENDFFEAYRELDRGVRELLDANITVLAVAGNHDVQVLPRLADQLPGFELLGRNGAWQTRTIEAGGEHLTVHGWSFPQRTVTASPLAGHRFERGRGTHIGLLHCDLDQRASRYAPVAQSELHAAGLDGWLLGHIHRPSPLDAASLFGYLGSATGLHPNEHGTRGPWLITIDGGRVATVAQWSIAPLHWAHMDVDVGGIAAAEDARERLLGAVHELARQIGAHALPPVAVGLRVALTGRSNLRAQLEQLFTHEDLGDVSVGGGIRYFVEDWRVMTEPEHDLAALAQIANPLGLLARRLLLLERPQDDPERQALLERARERLAERHGKVYWHPLDVPPPEDAAIAQWLREAGLAALDALRLQRTGES